MSQDMELTASPQHCTAVLMGLDRTNRQSVTGSITDYAGDVRRHALGGTFELISHVCPMVTYTDKQTK